MEIIRDWYSSEHGEEEPLIVMDEASKQLCGHLYPPLARQPGRD